MSDEVTIESLQAEVEKFKSRNAKLNKENLRYRTQRNEAFRENTALRTVATAHSVNVEEVITESNLEPLKINASGEVEGEFVYKAPSLKQAKKDIETTVAPKDKTPVALDAEAIDNMSYAEIDERWDECLAVWQQLKE